MTRQMTRAEFDYFKASGGREQWKWWNWPVTLSCNKSGKVWACSTYGHTPHEDRDDLQGRLALLDEIVTDVLRERPNGGRFHVDDTGVILAANRRRITEFVIR